MKTFDAHGNLLLNKNQIDQLLEEFDQTDPALQRQIVAAFVGMAKEAKDLLEELWCVACKDAFQRANPDISNRVREFLQ